MQTKYAMHQDLTSWPKTEKPWTATFSLAITDSTLENGCLEVISNSNYESRLRKHQLKQKHNECCQAQESRSLPHDKVIHLPIKKGDVTIHNERIVHGSQANTSPHWRKMYFMSFRDKETIKQQQGMGFSHSRNNLNSQCIKKKLQQLKL